MSLDHTDTNRYVNAMATGRATPDADASRGRAPGGGARSAAKAETRRALVEAALAAFAEQGLDAPSLDAICARAGFTRGALYVHFRDREDLLVAAMEHALGALLDAVLAAGDDDLPGAVRRYVDLAARGLDDLGEAPPPAVGASGPAVGASGPAAAASPPAAGLLFHQVLAACQRSDTIRERLVSILERAALRLARAVRAGQADGRVRADASPEDVARLLLLLALGVRAAADIRLPMPVGRTRDALLALLGPGAAADR